MSSSDVKAPQGAEKELAPLPAHFAFVVQLGRESDPTQGHFVGQIEHLASGRQGRFSNQQEMLTFLNLTLAQTIATAGDDKEA